MAKWSNKSHASYSLAAAGGVAAAMLALGARAAAPPAEETSLTIYSSAQPGAIPPEYFRPLPGQGVPNSIGVPGFAMVRHDRAVSLPAGRSTLRFTDVAALIDPTTVSFTSLTDPNARVLEQNFQFDLVSTDKLLQKYVDKPLTVERNAGNGAVATTTGTLLTAADGLVIRGQDGTLTALRDYQALKFPELPGGLITRPTLEWDISASQGGQHRARVAYQTGGITWWADYNLLFTAGRDANNGFVDVASWVSIINQSGASYPDAKLKLIAGEVNRAQPPRPQEIMLARAAMAADSAGFEEKSFDEFHLYTLGRRTTLPNNSTKQIELFDAAHRVPAQRLLVYSNGLGMIGRGAPYMDSNFPGQGDTRVDTYLVFRNDKAAGLGVPLPAGRIRVSRLDAADGSLEFVGEDVMNHTPRDERVRVKLGAAFDVVGSRRQVDFASDQRARWIEEEIEVELRNHKDEAVEVQVREFLYRWNNWRIVTSTPQYQKEDASTIIFPVKVAANGSSTVRYRVRYSW